MNCPKCGGYFPKYQNETMNVRICQKCGYRKATEVMEK
jgi:DNA-directed RNA polymerase subunit M/transcription elongation factor TFIIS